MKINKLEIENVKRVKAVRIEPAQNGLTVIGGKNGQGKMYIYGENLLRRRNNERVEN